MRKILIATPAYSGQLTVQTAQSLDQAKEEARTCGWEARSALMIGSADIADIRNQILGLFLSTSCDDLLFVDADVSWGAGTFKRIMTHNVDFVAGLYRHRTDAVVEYSVVWPEQRVVFTDEGGTGLTLLQADAVPAGFLRLSRNCVETMASQEGVPWVRDPNKIGGVRYPFLFDWAWIRHETHMERKSEDFIFCHRWCDTGGKVWVDPSLKINHTGQKVFAGDFMAWLKVQQLAAPPVAQTEDSPIAAVG